MKRNLMTAGTIALAMLLAPAAAFAGDKPAKSPTPNRIAFGAETNLADYVVPGKTTIFDFTSHYCPPCERISPMLDKLHADRDDIVVVKIDINRADVKGIDWKSPVARQYDLHFIPQFKIFGPDGKLVSEGEPASAEVEKMLGPDAAS